MDFRQAIQGKILLAPMAGVTDRAFRGVCKAMGADLTYTEMVSAKALQFKNKKTRKLLDIGEIEKPAAVQLFGNEPDVMAEMAGMVSETYGDDIFLIDINMGCPAPKIVNNSEGSALMKNPVLAGQIIRKVKDSVRLPVTVKIRKGFAKNDNLAADFARHCADSGADMVTVHGRTREQYYAGKADWQVIADVKKALEIPVVGNGDIFSAEDAKRMFEATGVDAVMVARGALGNPFLFREIQHVLANGEILPAPKISERMDVLFGQAKEAVRLKGERMAMVQMRKHAAWYIKGIKNASIYREALVRVSTLDELCDILEQIKHETKD